MQSYDPNQPQRSHDGGGYYQQQQQQQSQSQQPRMTLPPASSFFGPQSSAEYHHINTPLSEPPPSPYLTGHYNQPQSYPSTDPSTPYMHSSAISPPNNNYNIGPSPHYPPPPSIQQQQQMYNPPSVDQHGYIGIEQQHHGHPQQILQQQQQPIPPPQHHHQIQMGYPSTSMMQPQDPHSMQMGYISPMEQGIMGGNYQHQNYSNLPPQHPQQQVMHQIPTSMIQQQQQIPPSPQQLQQLQQQHFNSHSGQTPPIRGHHAAEMSNNSMLRNHLRQPQPQSIPSSTMQRGPLPSQTTTMESIVPSSENMTQILQMQQQSSQQQQQQQQQIQQNSSQKQEREGAATTDNNKTLPPQPSSNYNMPQQQQSQINQEMDQRRYDGSNIVRYPHQNYSNPINSEQNYRHNTPMGPPPIPHRVYHEQQQQQVSQEYHQQQQQIFDSQQQHHHQQQRQLLMSNFPPHSMNNESINIFQTKAEQPPISQTELSIAETVNEVIAKHSAKLPNDNNSISTPSPPPPKKRRNTRPAESVSNESNEQPQIDGPTVKQHFQAQQNEKRKQEQQDKYLTKIREDKEKYQNTEFSEIPETFSTEAFRGPGMTRTEFLQAHRQRKSESNQEICAKQFEKDTVVKIIEEIAASSFPDRNSPEPPPYEFSNQHFDDNIQIMENDNIQHGNHQTNQSFDEMPDTSIITPSKPKPKRIRKKPPPRETKVQKENKRKFLFKCLHLQRTVRSLILKNSALADETSRLFYRIKTVTEERKMLAKRVQHYERNRIRRIQSQKKKKAKAEAQKAQAFVEQLQQQQEESQQESNYPPSVEIYEPEIVQESVEAYPFENMIHKEMTVYLPPMNEDFDQIPYLDPSQYPTFEGFRESQNPNLEHSNAVYNMPSQFDDQNFQSFPTEAEEGPLSKRQRLDPTSVPFENQHFFNSEDDNNSHHSFFEHHQQHQQQQPISRSETPTFRETPNSSSAASSRPQSSLSGQLKRTIR